MILSNFKAWKPIHGFDMEVWPDVSFNGRIQETSTLSVDVIEYKKLPFEASS
jgi:hypothetical protein